MIRVIGFLIVVGALALGAAWLADRPGDVVITWQRWRIETSVMVLGAAIVIAVLALMLLWTLVRAVVRAPDMVSAMMRNRRGDRAYQAISRGLIAVGSGDMTAAHKFMTEANRLAPREPLAMLLSAQAAQLSGDRAGAERAFRAMASRPDTKVLGLHGLYIEAQRRDDMAAARAYAEEAARTAPALGWAGQAVLEFRCATGDWAGALAMLERNKGAIDKASYRRQRAVLLLARAMAAEETDRDNAKAFALEAVKLAPTLVPAAAFAGRMLAEGGDLRKAARVIDRAWRANPHPDLAESYAQIRFGDSARDRLTRVESLARKAPGHIEGALAVARAALDAQEFAKARAALAPYLSAPTQRVALLMAELERSEHGDEGRAREWMARALNAAQDPAWTADGFVSDRWMPVSPVTGRLDAFEWKVPLAGVVGVGAVIEPLTGPAIETMSKPAGAVEPMPAIEAMPMRGAAADRPETVEAETPPAAEPGGPRPRRRAARPARKPDAVIPLVHAPDDPGLEPELEPEPAPEPPPDGWRRIFK
jgi:HemY protein